MKNRWISALAIAAAIVVAIQFVPLDRSNPPVSADFDGPVPVQDILHRACYDCHSNETRWPWYSRIAPVSWLVVHDVHEAREHLNFSEWTALDLEDRLEMTHEIWEEVEEGEMPLWFYLPLHPEAALEESDLEILRRWSMSVEAAG